MNEFTKTGCGNMEEQTEEMNGLSDNVSADMVTMSGEEPQNAPSETEMEDLDFVDGDELFEEPSRDFEEEVHPNETYMESTYGEGTYSDEPYAEGSYDEAVFDDVENRGGLDNEENYEGTESFQDDSYVSEDEAVSYDSYEEQGYPQEEAQEYPEEYPQDDPQDSVYETDCYGSDAVPSEEGTWQTKEGSEGEIQHETLEESLAAIEEIESENANEDVVASADNKSNKKSKGGSKKAAKKQKKIDPAKEAKREKKAQKKAAKKKKGDVPFFRSIRFKLIASFLVPVIGIIVLGLASYSKASEALVSNYKESVQQTVNMMQEYISLIVTSEKDEFKTYLTKTELQQYFARALSDEQMAATKQDYIGIVRNKMALDTKIKGFYFLYDNRGSIYINATFEFPDDAYSAYMESAQGQIVANDKVNWLIFGQDPEADEKIHINTDTYALRMVRRFNDAPACIMVDFDANFIRTAMQSMDPGEGGYVVMITSDGAEFYSDEEVELEEPLVYGTDFYNAAIEGEEDSGATEVNIDGKEYLFVYSKLQTGDVLICSLVPSARILAETKDIKQLSVILIIIASVIALGLGTLMSSQMAGTIKYILRQLRKVAEGNLTVKLTAKSKDEFGLLCDGVNNTVEHVKDLIVHVNEVSNQLNDAAAYVSEASGTFMETSHDIQNAVSEIEVGVNRLDMGSADCLSQMDSLSGKIANVSTNADEIGKLTSSTGETINNGIESVQGLTSSAASTTRITQSVIEAIEELEQKSKSINKIVSSINEIAEQTNLLSLNASIEAARAGEAGKGFAVVAEEIRRLSDQCLKSSGQINNIVNEIVGKTKDVVVIAREAEAVVSSQAGAVEETTSSFRLIDQQVEHLLLALATISDNVQEMNSSRTETLEAIESISAVSAETAACSNSVYSTAGTQLSAVEDLDNAAQQLRRRADKLVEVLSTFTV